MFLTFFWFTTQLEVDAKNSVSAGAQSSGFHLLAAFEKTKAMFDENNFAAVNSRDDLVSKLDSAIGDSGKSVRLDL